MEAVQLADKRARRRYYRQDGKLQTALLSVSHNLRTPLASITGVEQPARR